MELLQTETNIGLIRKNNEDTAIAINHPKNKNLKLLLVADGMGGKANGELASSYVKDSIKDWFIKKDVKTINNTERLEQLIKNYIQRLNTNLIKRFGENNIGTTLTMAIINNKETLFVNIGDSRGYIYKENRLIQVTEDDSAVWMYYKYNEVKKDDLRYFSNNNIISACVGLCKDFCTITTKILKNEYNMLLLFTDGVTDMITDKKLEKIIKKSKQEDLSKIIINEAINVDQHLNIPIRLKRKKLYDYIVPFRGKDNATTSIFIKNA